MDVNIIGKREFLDLVRQRRSEFLARIEQPQAFAVKEFYDRDAILAFRNEVFSRGQDTEPSWHPLVDDCPDYHRLHDDYPKAYVKAKMHAFYFHGWYEHNKEIFDFFREIFQLKNFLAGFREDEFMQNMPSDGFVARVNVHHYPRGGGYQAEHIDPVGKHAQIQTLIIASEFGQDYKQGGVYGRSAAGSPRTYLDPHVGPGDVLIMSPGIHHGVDSIDPDAAYDWRSNNGRWMILPIIVGSDYPNPAVAKPVQVSGTIS